MMTIIMVAMQNSILSIESVQTGWKADESLKQTQPQCVAIDTLVLTLHIAEHLVMACGKLRILDILGIEQGGVRLQATM